MSFDTETPAVETPDTVEPVTPTIDPSPAF